MRNRIRRQCAARGLGAAFAAGVCLAFTAQPASASTADLTRAAETLRLLSPIAEGRPTPACPQARMRERKEAKRRIPTEEMVIVSLIDAGRQAWNATLGGIMPAPELTITRSGRA